jgi:hypothetical protein
MTSGLRTHVTRLAQAYEVFGCVSCLGIREISVRAYVVDRQAVAHKLAAVGAMPSLCFDHLYSSFQPALATVCLWASNPKRRLRSALELAPILAAAFGRAVDRSMSFLVHTPRLLFKRPLAVTASEDKRFYPFRIIPSPHHRRPCAVVARMRPHSIHMPHRRSTFALAGAVPTDRVSLGQLSRSEPFDGSAFLTSSGEPFNPSHQVSIRRVGGTGTVAKWRVTSNHAAKSISRTNLERQMTL